MAHLIVQFLAGSNRLEALSSACYYCASEVLEQFMNFGMFVRVRVVVSIVKALSAFLPHQIQSCVFSGHVCNSFSVEVKARRLGDGLRPQELVARNAIGRALSQSLELVNETPASSRKYGFVREIADNLVCENIASGKEALVEVNRLALKVGFSTAISQLVQFFERRKTQQQAEGLSWLQRILRGLASTTFSFPFLGSIWSLAEVLLQSSQSQSAMVSLIVEHENRAEKLVQELLWMAEKLRECLAIEDAIIHWSSAASLATLSRHASPRAQQNLIKLSIFLLQEMASAKFSAPEDVSLHLLLLWLPLLCTPVNGVDGIAFTASQRLEAEKLIEQIISALPKTYQESIISVWLHEFIQSCSDWPNLKNCYDSWCHEIRMSDFGICE